MEWGFTKDGEPAFPPRHELKYYINEAEHARLSGLLGAVLKRDRHGDAYNEYAIRSLYFDDAFDSAYREKLSGSAERAKYRIRIYNNSDEFIYLECKRKLGNLIGKDSVRITRRLADQLIEGRPDGLAGAAHPLLRDMFLKIRTLGMRPVVIVDYLREAYTHPAENTRITFDKRIQTGMFRFDLFNPELPLVGVLDAGVMVMEVKFDRFLPDYIRALIGGTSADLAAISKYVLCRGHHMLAE